MYHVYVKLHPRDAWQYAWSYASRYVARRFRRDLRRRGYRMTALVTD